MGGFTDAAIQRGAYWLAVGHESRQLGASRIADAAGQEGVDQDADHFFWPRRFRSTNERRYVLIL